jgi:hypothetical protein
LEIEAMKNVRVFLIWLSLSCFSRADILSGQMQWNEETSTVTNVAIFSFDTVLQTGSISNFWVDENGTFTENGFLADGGYDFTVSSDVATYDELTDFDTIIWSVYDERIIGVKIEEVSALFSSNQFHAEHWDYLLGGNFTYSNGTFSVVPKLTTSAIPEPASALLFCFGGLGAFLFRKKRRAYTS